MACIDPISLFLLLTIGGPLCIVLVTIIGMLLVAFVEVFRDPPE